MVYRYTLLAAAASVLMLAVPVAAIAANAKMMQVAARTIGFFSGFPSGVEPVMVIYDPANPASKTEAERAVAALKASKTSKLSFEPVLTPVGAMGDARIAYVTQGLSAHYATIASRAAERGILTFTHDRACVEAKQCVMYVNSEPSVEIIISQSAAAAARVQMPSALKMMVKEVE